MLHLIYNPIKLTSTNRTSGNRTRLKFGAVKKFTNQSQKQKQFVQHCSRWVAKNNRAISIVEEEFRRDISHVDQRINTLSRTTVLHQLKTMDDNIGVLMRHRLNSAESVSFTTNVRSDESGNSYPSITVLQKNETLVFITGI